MRTRQAQQLQADVLARLDETGSSKPASGDSLEWINQAWAKVYRKLIQAGVQWNMRTSTFTSVNGQDTYGTADGAWTSALVGLTLVSGGSYQFPSPAFTISSASGVGTPATAHGTGTGSFPTPEPITSITLDTPGVGLQAPLVFTSTAVTPAVITPILLPDYWKTQSLAVQSGSFWRPVHRFQQEQEYEYQQSGWSWPETGLFDVWGGTSDAQGLDGTVLKLIPPPAGGMLLRHRWYPAPLRLVNPTDVFDGIAGGELAVIYQACAEAALQTEQFEMADRFEAKASAELTDLMSSLRDRNVGEAPMARVVRGRPTAHRGLGGGSGRWRW